MAQEKTFCFLGAKATSYSKEMLQTLEALEKDEAAKRKRREGDVEPESPSKRARAPAVATDNGRAVMTIVHNGVEHRKCHGPNKNQWERTVPICNYCDTYGE